MVLLIFDLFARSWIYSDVLYIQVCKRVTRGGRGGGVPSPFLKIEKSALICGEKTPWLWSSMRKVYVNTSYFCALMKMRHAKHAI